MEVARVWRGSCEDCAHWNWDKNSQDDEGRIIGAHCGLFSCDCPTAIFDTGKPTRFLSWHDALVKDGGLKGRNNV